MTKYARISRSKYERLQGVLKAVISLRQNPTLKQVINAAKLSENLLEDIRNGSILEEPTTRLISAEGLYFVIMRDRITHLEFADERPRLPIFRTMREAVVSMERNGWTEENRYQIHRIDLVKIKNPKFASAIIEKYKKSANGTQEDLSGDS